MKPTVLVKGGDYRPDQVVGRELVEAQGGEVVLVDLVPGFSTTRIVETLAQAALAAEDRPWPIHPSSRKKSNWSASSSARTIRLLRRGRRQPPADGSQTWHLEQPAGPACWSSRSPILRRFWSPCATAKVFAVACIVAGQCRADAVAACRGPARARSRRMAPGSKPALRHRRADAHARQHPEEAQAPAPIDLLSVDVEGHELEVLRGFDFERWQPLLILIEDHVGNLTPTGFEGERLSADPPLEQRLVRAGERAVAATAGRSCANTILRCRSA